MNNVSNLGLGDQNFPVMSKSERRRKEPKVLKYQEKIKTTLDEQVQINSNADIKQASQIDAKVIQLSVKNESKDEEVKKDDEIKVVKANALTADESLSKLENNSLDLSRIIGDLKAAVAQIRENIRTSINAAKSKDTNTSNLEQRKADCGTYESVLKEKANQWKELLPKTDEMIKNIDVQLADQREFNLQPDYKQKIEKLGLKVLQDIQKSYEEFHARRVGLDTTMRNLEGIKASIADLIFKADNELDTLRSYAALPTQKWFFNRWIGQPTVLQEAPVAMVNPLTSTSPQIARVATPATDVSQVEAPANV